MSVVGECNFWEIKIKIANQRAFYNVLLFELRFFDSGIDSCKNSRFLESRVKNN